MEKKAEKKKEVKKPEVKEEKKTEVKEDRKSRQITTTASKDKIKKVETLKPKEKSRDSRKASKEVKPVSR